jgi:hypothetical protein
VKRRQLARLRFTPVPRLPATGALSHLRTVLRDKLVMRASLVPTSGGGSATAEPSQSSPW